ncbi:MAG: type B 50S ribosomal protein L31 [Actinomycetota bacterium]
MKSDIHPDYRFVVFQDMSAGTSFLTKSTISTSETVTWEDGNEYPLAKVEISSESHPFFTGQMKIVDTAGRVERFEKRYGRRKAAAAPAEAEGEAEVAAADAESSDD